VRLLYERSRAEATLARLDARIDALADYIDTLADGTEKTLARLEKTALEKRRSTLADGLPEDIETTAWCADHTTDMTGDVGTAEVAGERQEVLIRPGYGGAALYDAQRDGQLQHALAGTPASVFYNLSMMPGWQRWLPTYRLGTIISGSIDNETDTCSVCLDPANSTHRNINVNQESSFGGCSTSAPSGFTTWASENPTHPLAANTEDPDPLHVTDALYDELVSVQTQVNVGHEYLTDVAGWGVGEVWRIMEAGQSGDCEDFALTKADALLDSGWEAGHLRIAFCETEFGTPHAVLVVETANRGTLVLDNRYDLPMRLESLPYRWVSRQKAGATWERYSPTLTDVPISYMSCNAAAFSDNDRVLVEFLEQDWDDPRVIGFETQPAQCANPLYMATRRVYIQEDYEGDGHIYRRDTRGNWALAGSIEGMPEVSDIVVFGENLFVFAAKDEKETAADDIGAVYYSSDGETWTVAETFGGFWNKSNASAPPKVACIPGRLTVCDGALFAAINKHNGSNSEWWTAIYKSTNGFVWDLFWSCDLGDGSTRNNELADFVSIDDNLFITVRWVPLDYRSPSYPMHDRTFKIDPITAGETDYSRNQSYSVYENQTYRMRAIEDGSVSWTYVDGEWVPEQIIEYRIMSSGYGYDGYYNDWFWWGMLADDGYWYEEIFGYELNNGGPTYCIGDRRIYAAELQGCFSSIRYLLREEYYLSWREDYLSRYVDWDGATPFEALAPTYEPNLLTVAALNTDSGISIWVQDDPATLEEDLHFTKIATIDAIEIPMRIIEDTR